MILNIQKKKNIIAKINKIAHIALSVIIADTRTVNVNKITQLRKHGRINNVKIHVVKNTLLKISFQNTSLECLNNHLFGPSLIAFSINDSESAIKLFHNFHKNNKNFKIITAALHGKILSPLEINQIANLPSYQEAIIHLIITIKTATIGKLLFVLLAIKQKKCTIK
ncbi:50S ribosomal protein L10 [Buchnera aphidicola (Phyllaphis fagi)]|uniref:50S ribosomal protein L10 n=1 Tax=Buchnera aphidicola TaxID=9 RepID=UPI003463CADE